MQRLDAVPDVERPHLLARLAVLAVLLLAATAGAQTAPNTPPTTPPKRPATATTTRPQTTTSRWHLPFTHPNNTANSNNSNAANNAGTAKGANPPRHFWDLFHRNNNSPAAGNAAAESHAASGTAPLARLPANHAASNGSAPTHAADRMHLASLGTNPAATTRAMQSQSLLGHAAPPGSHDTTAPNGTIVRTAADGSVLAVRNPNTGMTIQHGLDGSRRIMVEQPDGSRIFAPTHGVAYVQHPYLFQAQPFDHRTFYQHGQLSHQFYRPYNYHGTTLDVYAPQRLYSPQVYQWASSRYDTPLVPSWNYVTGPSPWFAYYKGYFTPQPSYASPLLWLTDYVLATSLIAAYNTRPPTTAPPTTPSPTTALAMSAPPTAAPPASAPPTSPQPAAQAPTAPPQSSDVTGAAAPAPAAASAEVTPEVKEMLADEVGRQIRQESIEAQQNADHKDPAPGAGGIVEELAVREPHVFVVASDLDLVDPSGRRCMVSEGDVVQVISAARPASATADAVVLASKGGVECERATQVPIALTDLQEMQNHMRETIDQGLANTREGRGAATTTPAFAASAPPPDPNAAHEIDQQAQIAAAAAS